MCRSHVICDVPHAYAYIFCIIKTCMLILYVCLYVVCVLLAWYIQVWRASCTRVKCDMTRPYVSWLSHVAWLIYMWHDTLISFFALSFIHMWHDTFVCDMTHSYVTWLNHTWHDSFIHDLISAHGTWLMHLRVSCAIVCILYMLYMYIVYVYILCSAIGKCEVVLKGDTWFELESCHYAQHS